MKIDQLWADGPRFIQREPVFRIGTDAVLLAEFTDAKRAKSAADLGCGSGVLAILLARRSPKLLVDCLDILPEAQMLTLENAKLNGLEAQIRAQTLDIREIRGSFPAGTYDLVVSNPPYFPSNSGKRANKPQLANARDEACCTLEDICAAASYLLRWGGRFSLVHRPERLSELFVAMVTQGIEPKRLRMVASSPKGAPSLVLVEGKRGGAPGLLVSVSAP